MSKATFNPLISAETREAMIDLFDEQYKALEIAKGIPTGTADRSSVYAADDTVFERFGFRIRDLFVR